MAAESSACFVRVGRGPRRERVRLTEDPRRLWRDDERHGWGRGVLLLVERLDRDGAEVLGIEGSN